MWWTRILLRILFQKQGVQVTTLEGEKIKATKTANNIGVLILRSSRALATAKHNHTFIHSYVIFKGQAHCWLGMFTWKFLMLESDQETILLFEALFVTVYDIKHIVSSFSVTDSHQQAYPKYIHHYVPATYILLYPS